MKIDCRVRAGAVTLLLSLQRKRIIFGVGHSAGNGKSRISTDARG